MTETARCHCGCGTSFPRLDRWGRPRRFVNGHNPTRFPSTAPGPKKRLARVRFEVPEQQADRLIAALLARGFSRRDTAARLSLKHFRAVKLYPGRVCVEWNELEHGPRGKSRHAQPTRKKRKPRKAHKLGRPWGTRSLAPVPPRFKAGDRVRLSDGEFAGQTGFVLQVPAASAHVDRQVKFPYRVQLDGRKRPVPAAEGWLEEEPRSAP